MKNRLNNYLSATKLLNNKTKVKQQRELEFPANASTLRHFRGMKAFEIRFLDHVAIRVRDIETSANWYEKILGLKRMNIREWGDFPVLMSCGKTGIAIFPANLSDLKNNLQSKNTGISHFAFNLSNEDFNKAKEYYKKLALEFVFQDHFYFHSIYIQDPDEHTVELTTIVVEEDAFYR